MRLIMVASNSHQRQLLETGAELCRTEAALYLRVHETCPLFYATWDGDPLHGVVGVSSKVSRQRPCRSRNLDPLRELRAGGAVTSAHVPAERRHGRSSSALQSLFCRADCCVVGTPAFRKSFDQSSLGDEPQGIGQRAAVVDST